MKSSKDSDNSGRRLRGRARESVLFPAAPPKAELPKNYGALLSEIKARVATVRVKTVLAANAAMVLLYWDIGRLILANQDRAGWGAKVIDRLAADLKRSFPDMAGLSQRNLLFMRAFAEAYPEPSIVKQLVSQIPWGHIVRLIQAVKDEDVRAWYIRETMAQGWSRSILELQIGRKAHDRQGQAVHNFEAVLPPPDSDMAAQVFKDPYIFDFLGTADPRREAEVEQALVDHIQRFLVELGSGFAFVGRQVHLEFSSRDFYLDLLFYHLHLRCYVVIELLCNDLRTSLFFATKFLISDGDLKVAMPLNTNNETTQKIRRPSPSGARGGDGGGVFSGDHHPQKRESPEHRFCPSPSPSPPRRDAASGRGIGVMGKPLLWIMLARDVWLRLSRGMWCTT